MSTLLWVEDFEDKQYRTTTFNVFGRALNLTAADIPDEVNDLREFLEMQQVTLATNFAEASRIIDERLSDFDGIVLDIDLELLGEDFESDFSLLEHLLKRCYHYDPDSDGAEAAYDKARGNMKMIAGYHLYVELVVNRGFQRNRIQFCSQHGDQLEKALKSSFDTAHMERPAVWIKSDPRVGDWISNVREDPYTKLRRWVILACREMLVRLRFNQTTFLMLDLPNCEGLTLADAENLLETLQLLMPPYVRSEKEKKNVFRLFVRTLTQDWDKVKKSRPDPRKPNAMVAYAAVLIRARHWTSHSAKALSELTEADVAFLFLIALHACFKMQDNGKNEFEAPLLSLIGGKIELDMEQLKQNYGETYQEVTDRWQMLPKELRGYPDKVPGEYKEPSSFCGRIDMLQKAGEIQSDQYEKGLRQIFWHTLHQPNPDFSPKVNLFSKPVFLGNLTSRLYRSGF